MKVVKTCVICGTEFVASKMSGIYCSKKCSRVAMRKRKAEIKSKVKEHSELLQQEEADMASLEKTLLATKDLQKLFGVSSTSVYRYLQSGILKVIKMSPKWCSFVEGTGTVKDIYKFCLTIREHQEDIRAKAKEYMRQRKNLNKRYSAIQKARRRVNALMEKGMITHKESLEILNPLRRELQELYLLLKQLKYSVFGEWLRNDVIEERRIMMAVRSIVHVDILGYFFDSDFFIEQLSEVDDKGYTTINLMQ